MKRFERARAAASKRACRGASKASRGASRGKTEKEKNIEKVKKVSKGRKIQRSPKWYKIKHLARVQNGPLRGDVRLESKIAAK